MEIILYLPRFGAYFEKKNDIWIYTKDKKEWLIYNTVKIYNVLDEILKYKGNHYCIRLNEIDLNILPWHASIINNWMNED